MTAKQRPPNPIWVIIRLWMALSLGVFLSTPAYSQGFAGLGSDADGFTLPQANPAFMFPNDHGAHPDFRIEWWYVTANLIDSEGTEYGVQWTLFRTALAPKDAPLWDSAQIWFAHAGLTTDQTHYVGQRFARGGIGQAGVLTQPFAAWIDDWSMESRLMPKADADALDDLTLTARGEDFSYDLNLTAGGPLVFHGQDGFSVKSPKGQASYYYSQPYYQVSGKLGLPNGPVTVTGKAWLDREWSSQPLAPSQTGWDWFSLHLNDGAKLMVYRMRDTEAPDHIRGSFIEANGASRHIPDGKIALKPLAYSTVSGRQIPTSWQVSWPDQDIDLRIDPVNAQSWMGTNIPYWEGPVRISGSHGGQGYVEMTGYE